MEQLAARRCPGHWPVRLDSPAALLLLSVPPASSVCTNRNTAKSPHVQVDEKSMWRYRKLAVRESPAGSVGRITHAAEVSVCPPRETQNQVPSVVAPVPRGGVGVHWPLFQLCGASCRNRILS